METLIAAIMSKTGLDEDTIREAVTIILSFLNKEAPADRMQQVFDVLPGAAELVAARGSKSKGGLLAGLGAMVPGMGAMNALNELSAAGLDMTQIQTVVKTLVGFAKEKAGDEAVDEVISSIPGLSQIL
ncbi:DUF2267 domain-containing protein [Roseibium litorale]|uniref:DUF2267 domain-containing protein n=1 Tax=Roseibium litorale TaxID=2803841 RepID=A0ABR9CTL5_9HYPH|nr:DUF2267 domain-containing protein [Roseibium litorale]MBD8893969.1 DUF2267 domain-containing protein [Roseibium litorale]